MIELSDELSEKLRSIENKIDFIKRMLRDLMESERLFDLLSRKTSHETHRSINAEHEVVNVYLLKLPDSLRLTMFAMDKLKEASAFQVARVTGRSRSVESFHLNQLERMGYLVKSRRGKKMYFRIPRPASGKRKKSGGIFL